MAAFYGMSIFDAPSRHAFDASGLRARLQTLDVTQASVTSVAQYLLYHAAGRDVSGEFVTADAGGIALRAVQQRLDAHPSLS